MVGIHHAMLMHTPAEAGEVSPYIGKRLGADGATWIYYAKPAAEDGTHYEFEGEWFYVLPNDTDYLSWLLWDFLQDSQATHTTVTGVPIKANNIITTRITEFLGTFWGEDFNQPIGSWDMSNATTIQWMFHSSSFNQPIGGWELHNVENASWVFDGAYNFNQPIGTWQLRSCVDADGMLYDASAFDQDLSGMCVPLLTSKPEYFDTGTTAWNKTGRQPIWGTCPDD